MTLVKKGKGNVKKHFYRRVCAQDCPSTKKNAVVNCGVVHWNAKLKMHNHETFSRAKNRNVFTSEEVSINCLPKMCSPVRIDADPTQFMLTLRSACLLHREPHIQEVRPPH